MPNIIRNSLTVLVAVFLASRAFAAGEPTSEQIYQAAQSGRLQQAEQMIGQVLQNHPKSGKAHYVAAEVYAKEGRTSAARRELNTAQELAPGLPFAKPASIAALQNELADATSSSFLATPTHSQARSIAPWGMLVLLAGGLALLWFLVRPRAPVPVYSNGPFSTPGGASIGGTTVLGGTPGGGIGSGIAGGLASGLAVGAGVVAGEELARHFLDSDRDEHVMSGTVREPVESIENGAMGGDDFGLNDGSSWDDTSGGGGEDWS